MSIKKKLILITVVFSIFIVLLMGMNYLVMNTLSTVRAYIAAEGLWSKGQKDAIYYLLKYAITQNEIEFHHYKENIAIALGDKLARLELQKDQTDFNLVREGFARGRNHVEDIIPMAVLFKRFQHFDFFKKTIVMWTQADEEITKLEELSEEIHQLVLDKKLTPELIRNYISKIDVINKRLTILETNYSNFLGVVARWMTSNLFYFTLSIAVICLIFSLWISIYISRNILDSIELLRAATIRVEQGNLTSAIAPIDTNPHSLDELTDLALSFNKMMTSLNQAIDERNTAQEKLELRARQLAETQQLAHIYTWVWDINNSEMFATEEFYKILGIDPSERLTYELLLSKVHPHDRDLVSTVFGNVMQKKLPFHIDHQIITSDDEIRVLSVHGRPVLDEEGNIVRIIGYTQDITERLKIQSQLVQSSKMASLGEMASGIAHEINNPLTIIKLSATQLQKNIETDPNASPSSINCIMKIDSTVDRISKIIQGLRAFSRDGKNDRFEEVSLEKLIEDILSFCSEKLKHHSINLIKENITSEIYFEARPIEISQVILNLLNNAFDATDTELNSEKWIKISAVDSADFLDIKITDSGKGIAPELQTKIFQPFFTSKEIGKGTGLGLSLSMTIINNHKGDIFLDTTNENTSFVVRLPKKQ